MSSKGLNIVFGSVFFILVGSLVFFLGSRGVGAEINIKWPRVMENKNQDWSGSVGMGQDSHDQEEIKLIFGGDVMMSRQVGVKIAEAGDSSLPFRQIGSLMSGADLTMVNLEAPFNDEGEMVTEGMAFKAEPETSAGLELAGIDMVCLANNHASNQGRKGISYTIDFLAEKGIKVSGAGKNREEAYESVFVEVKGTKIGFLSYTYSDGVEFDHWVDSFQPDVAFMDLERVRQGVKEAQEEADLVVVSMHDGQEYSHQPTAHQKEFARAAIEAGAKLVIGHHPHVVQSVEEYGDGFVVYSLGNLVFDQMWSEETQEGVMAEVILARNQLKRVKFVPINIDNFNQPRLATVAESELAQEHMGLESLEIEFPYEEKSFRD